LASEPGANKNSDDLSLSVFVLPANEYVLIKHAIYSAGTVSAGFDVYYDLFKYSGGVYTRNLAPTDATEKSIGRHAVAVIGYGLDSGSNGKKYWVFANSWGTAWGEAGYGRIEVEFNNVGFEKRVSYANPMLPFDCAAGTTPTTCGHGERTSLCSCTCYLPWGGALCNTCTRNSSYCLNGGQIDQASCKCACPSGYFGDACEFHVRAFWTPDADDNRSASFMLSWRLPPPSSPSEDLWPCNATAATSLSSSVVAWKREGKHTEAEAEMKQYCEITPECNGYFKRSGNFYGLSLGTSPKGTKRVDIEPEKRSLCARPALGAFFDRENENNTAVYAGWRQGISGLAGSLPMWWPQPFVSECRQAPGVQSLRYALFVPLGMNEFGHDRGYSLDPKFRPPPLLYDCNLKCFFGGHKDSRTPPATDGPNEICKSAKWDSNVTTPILKPPPPKYPSEMVPQVVLTDPRSLSEFSRYEIQEQGDRWMAMPSLSSAVNRVQQAVAAAAAGAKTAIATVIGPG